LNLRLTAFTDKNTVIHTMKYITTNMAVKIANTIGSKAQNTDIAHTVVAVKGEIEKIREQIQNIE